MWISVICTLIDNHTYHHSGQNVVDSRGTADWLYTCQLSHLMRQSHACGFQNFDLTPTHACGPISHAWLKNVSFRLAWHNFQKYVNSDPCKERKPCVKWISDNTFLAISDFWSEKHWKRVRVYTGTGTSEFFGRLWTSSAVFGNDCVVFKALSTPRIKISGLYLRRSWQVYEFTCRHFDHGDDGDHCDDTSPRPRVPRPRIPTSRGPESSRPKSHVPIPLLVTAKQIVLFAVTFNFSFASTK